MQLSIKNCLPNVKARGKFFPALLVSSIDCLRLTLKLLRHLTVNYANNELIKNFKTLVTVQKLRLQIIWGLS